MCTVQSLGHLSLFCVNIGVVVGVSDPSDIGSRSSSGDTGESELIVRVQSKIHTTRQLNVSCIYQQYTVYYGTLRPLVENYMAKYQECG